MCSNLPVSAVHDLAVHTGDRKLVIGTHGRSAWVMDVKPLQEAVLRIRRGERAFLLSLERPPGRKGSWRVYYYLPEAAGEARISLLEKDGKTMVSRKGPARAGLNLVEVKIPRSGMKKARRPFLVRVEAGEFELERRSARK